MKWGYYHKLDFWHITTVVIKLPAVALLFVMEPAKKRAKTKRCNYKSSWQASGVSASKRGRNYAHCDSCGTDFNIGHGGSNDVKRHLATCKHQEMAKVTSNNQSLVILFRQSPIEQAVTRAEVLFANFVTEHNLPFLLGDHFTHLTHAMFPDSQIAKAFKSGHTKTACVVTGALTPHFSVFKLCQELSSVMKEMTKMTRILPS